MNANSDEFGERLRSTGLDHSGKETNAPHRLDGVGVDDFLVRLPFRVIIATIVDELHLLEDSRLHNKSQGGELP